MLDLEKYKNQAMIMRNMNASEEDRKEAFAHASDTILRLCDEIETLRKVSSEDILKLTEKLNAIKLIPVGGEGSLSDLADAISSSIYDWALKHKGKSKNKYQTWDISAGIQAIDILHIIHEYLQSELNKQDDKHE